MSLGANHFQSLLTPFVSFESPPSLLGAVVFASDVPLRFFGGVGSDDYEAGAMKKPDVSDDADRRLG